MLSRYRILDLTDAGSALCGQILADLGADVILVEPPGGAPSRQLGPFAGSERDPNASLGFWAVNRNKRSVCLDLETAQGRQAFLRLVRGADVVVESYPPDHLAARGLGHEALSRENPGLVTVSITPYGQSGPKAHWPATDLTVTAASGVMVLTGDEDRAPLASSVPQAFLNAGAEAAVGALLALAARERDGLGQHVDVSAQTAMMMTTQSFVLCAGWNDTELQRLGGGIRLGDLRLRFVYPCKDGYANVTLLFGPALGPATARLFRWMYAEGVVDEATRDKDWIAYGSLLTSGQEPVSELDRCVAAVETFTRRHTKAELYEGAMARGVLIVPLSDMADLAASAQLASRDYWTAVRHPELGKDIRYPGPFAKFSGAPLRYRRRPPLLGEHDAEIAREPAAPVRPAPVRARASSAPGPMEGLKVLDLTWVYAGPMGTRYLADYGATVVRLETSHRIDALRVGQPFKDGVVGIERSGNYGNVNVNKLGICLNLNVEGALDIALRLVDWADVLVENFSPRAMKAWGMSYEKLRERNPQLIMVSTCLNGQTGPHANLAGYGTMGAALAGFGYLTGWPDRPPSAPFVAYTDYVSPRFIAASLLAALEHRRRTGKGQHIDCSQAECSIHLLASAVLEHQVQGRVPEARGNACPHYAPSGVYPCAGEDRWVAIAAPDETTWHALCRVADRGWQGDPRLESVEKRLANRESLDERVADWTAGLEPDEIEQALARAGVPVHRVSTSADLFVDPQMEAREHFVTLEHPEIGPVPLESSRMRFSRTPAESRGTSPTLGQHNEHVLKEILGLGDDEIAELVISGALE